jgi:hypothetical protein
MQMRRRFTPDLQDLNKKDLHYVFFPKKIGLNFGGFARIIRGKSCYYLGGATSVSGNFQKRTTELGDKLDVYHMQAGVNDGFSGHLNGFVAAVPVSEICQLDMSYDHMHRTKRVRRMFWLEAQSPKSAHECFVWLFNRDFLDRTGATRVVESHSKYNGSIKQLEGANILA